MPKKSKRRTTRVTSRPVQTTTVASKPFEFNPDYSYVAKDLRRIGALAGTFVLLLVILSFFLN
jgi:hypothetical protein